jgi:hypothetical protein
LQQSLHGNNSIGLIKHLVCYTIQPPRSDNREQIK